jgi:hypothetical protein
MDLTLEPAAAAQHLFTVMVETEVLDIRVQEQLLVQVLAVAAAWAVLLMAFPPEETVEMV